MWHFAFTVFLSAFLLFQVQPLIAREILPWFGGASSVWTSCMAFFQIALLAGYTYAHFVARRLSWKTQGYLHTGLLALSLLSLPIIPSAAWKPAGEGMPLWSLLGSLLSTVGLPYFLLSATNPLLQSWIVATQKDSFPWRLFALSNLASLLALLAYPFLIEPWLPLKLQAWVWSASYLVFVVLCGFIALRRATPVNSEAMEASAALPVAPAPPVREKLLWLLLAALPSFLLVAFTTHLTQNIAAMPFLWIAPLAIYLLTFVICFEREKPLAVWFTLFASPLMLAIFFNGLREWDTDTKLYITVPAFLGALLLFCLLFHDELARRRPAPQYLTGFYLMLSAGGAIGGLLAAVGAPLLLDYYYEMHASAAIAAFVLLCLYLRRSIVADLAWTGLAIFGVSVAGANVIAFRENALTMQRNFYGALRVIDNRAGDPLTWDRQLMHGTITHGIQFLHAKRRPLPTTYYGPQSGVGLVLEHRWHPVFRAGFVGLGAGTLASYCREGDQCRFYEINPQVRDIAQGFFAYLKLCRGLCEVKLGDARLTLESEEPNQYDLLAVDAFSGDAIPAHLLTREAFALYFRQLRPDGILALHVSNKYLDLEPVVQKLAVDGQYFAMAFSNDEVEEMKVYESDWILVAKQVRAFANPVFPKNGRPLRSRANVGVWTDDFNNLFSILRLRE
jgi:hypothetical protein